MVRHICTKRADKGAGPNSTSIRARVCSHQRASGGKESMRGHAFVQLTLASARGDAWLGQHQKSTRSQTELKLSLDAETRRFAPSLIKEAGVVRWIG
jgi:hypothetical protein